MTPPTTPPAIAPLSEEEPLGLGDALDEIEGLGDALDEIEGLGDALDEIEGLGSAMLIEGDKDKVALEAALEAEDEVAATAEQ